MSGAVPGGVQNRASPSMHCFLEENRAPGGSRNSFLPNSPSTYPSFNSPFRSQADDGIVMVDGGRFDGPKAYKDAKACNMLTIFEMHRRFSESRNITFNTMYPGECPLGRGVEAFYQPLPDWRRCGDALTTQRRSDCVMVGAIVARTVGSRTPSSTPIQCPLQAALLRRLCSETTTPHSRSSSPHSKSTSPEVRSGILTQRAMGRHRQLAGSSRWQALAP